MISLVQSILTVLLITITITNCTKIDSTTLGSDLIPSIDNVNTFQTDTFSLSTENGLFNDTSLVFKTDQHLLGNTALNPNFGQTNATVFVQFNPGFQFSWPNKADSLNNPFGDLDSAFVCLELSASANDNAIFGDSLTPMTFEVYRVTGTNFKQDSIYRLAVNPNITDDGIPIASITLAPRDINNLKFFTLKQRKDSIVNQLRIPLNATGRSWAKGQLLLKDTTNTFNSGTSFTTAIKGFAIKATGGNAIMKFNLSQSISSRFEMWYRYRKNGSQDTTNQFFFFNTGASNPWLSASANYVRRNLSGTTLLTATAPGIDNTLYIESTPGSFARIKMPHIKALGNKIIHRAELIITEAGANNPTLYSPSRMYLDVIDSAVPAKFKAVPFDFYITGNAADLNYFGGQRKYVLDGLGNTVSQYTFNVSKYIQSLISHGKPNCDFRLYAPYDSRYYSNAVGYFQDIQSTFFLFPVINLPTFGRVIVGGGVHPTSRMRLKITYSNI